MTAQQGVCVLCANSQLHSVTHLTCRASGVEAVARPAAIFFWRVWERRVTTALWLAWTAYHCCFVKTQVMEDVAAKVPHVSPTGRDMLKLTAVKAQGV